jgi:hypothetical protein
VRVLGQNGLKRVPVRESMPFASQMVHPLQTERFHPVPKPSELTSTTIRTYPNLKRPASHTSLMPHFLCEHSLSRNAQIGPYTIRSLRPSSRVRSRYEPDRWYHTVSHEKLLTDFLGLCRSHGRTVA